MFGNAISGAVSVLSMRVHETATVSERSSTRIARCGTTIEAV
jgi:hypothetical protein